MICRIEQYIRARTFKQNALFFTVTWEAYLNWRKNLPMKMETIRLENIFLWSCQCGFCQNEKKISFRVKAWQLWHGNDCIVIQKTCTISQKKNDNFFCWKSRFSNAKIYLLVCQCSFAKLNKSQFTQKFFFNCGSEMHTFRCQKVCNSEKKWKLLDERYVVDFKVKLILIRVSFTLFWLRSIFTVKWNTCWNGEKLLHFNEGFFIIKFLFGSVKTIFLSENIVLSNRRKYIFR